MWLLSLHPAASDRVYAATGAVSVAMALLWVAVVLAGLGVLISGGSQRN